MMGNLSIIENLLIHQIRKGLILMISKINQEHSGLVCVFEKQRQIIHFIKICVTFLQLKLCL